jgi:aryl-alcohol dehydrogenase-like predicted oxidoreductase
VIDARREAMPRRPLGKTGLIVTPIGLGLAALGRPAYITAGRADELGADRSIGALERRTHEVLSAAWESGVRYFDAARSYGYAERFLSSWLRRRHLAANDLTIGSKWGYTYVGDWRMDASVHEVKDHSAAALERQLDDSRALLGNFLSLYQIHSATLESGVLDDRAVMARLIALRAEGMVVGVSVSGPRQADVIRRALRISIDGVNPFQCVQATWNPLEPSAGPALADASDAGWGVIIKEALANGRLARQDQVAIAVALSNSWADVVLSGAVTVEQVRRNAAAVAMSIAEPDRQHLLSMAEPAERYWRERRGRPWS